MPPEDIAQIAALIAASEQRTAHKIEQAEHRTIEAVRDMQTEMLRGIEAFARGNFARMHRLETSDAATVEQLAALEERVMRLETRQQLPPH